jgi:hypothetical protein
MLLDKYLHSFLLPYQKQDCFCYLKKKKKNSSTRQLEADLRFSLLVQF